MDTTSPIPTIEELALQVYNFLNIQENPQEADVIFILGGSSLAPVYKALELYESGYAPYIAFVSKGGTFGGDKIWGISETEKYKETLLQLGVPKDALVYESDKKNQTQNTLEEAQYAIPFLKKKGIDAQRMILISRPIHQRRASATFEQQHPEILYINCPADEPFEVSTAFLKRLVQEVERLVTYGRKKDIDEPYVLPHTLQATEKIRNALSSSSFKEELGGVQK